VSSVNTEDGLTEEQDASKYHEETGDTLADLNNIQKQTKAMGKLNASQMNVRSLELSDTGAMVYCSSVDISENGNGNEVTIPAQPTTPTILEYTEGLYFH